MTTTKRRGIGAAMALALGLAACSKAHEPEPVTARSESVGSMRSDHATADLTPASRTRSAAEELAQARCERERQCGNIGKDQTYSSAQDCLARVQTDWKDELNARQCPGGINQRELSECLEQVRSESCGNPFDTLARMAECTSGQICVEQP